MPKPTISRRSMLGAGLAALGAATIPVAIAKGDDIHSNPPPTGAKRVLRFAHPTDIHVQPELRGGEGMTAAFKHMMSLQDPPALIITGGDLPMDTASSPYDRSKLEWDLFKKVLADTVPSRVPIHHTMGNHDIWGRDKIKCKATGDEPHYGKRWFLDNFGYDRTWHSFDLAGWHFIILDSISLLPDGDEFVARITGDQFEWFKQDLAATPTATPIVVVTHAPIISVANYFDKDDEEWDTQSPDLKVSAKRMHVDCRDFDALFQKHRNVKLCLSGHLHLLDRCEYNGVTHICDGAVCGAKWKGSKRQTPEGYGLIDLYADGTFRHEYMTYGWKV